MPRSPSFISYGRRDAALAQSNSHGASRLVLFAILHHADEYGYAFPSISVLEIKTGLSRESISRALQWLEEVKEVKIKRGGGRASNQYWVLVGQAVAVKQVDHSKENEPSTDLTTAVNGIDHSEPSTDLTAAVNLAVNRSDRSSLNLGLDGRRTYADRRTQNGHGNYARAHAHEDYFPPRQKRQGVPPRIIPLDDDPQETT